MSRNPEILESLFLWGKGGRGLQPDARLGEDHKSCIQPDTTLFQKGIRGSCLFWGGGVEILSFSLCIRDLILIALDIADRDI